MTGKICPLCRRPLAGNWQQLKHKTYAMGDALPVGASYESKQPAKDPRPFHVAAAALYSIGSFAALFLTGVVVTIISGIDDWFYAGVVLGLVAMVATWFSLLGAFQRILWFTEKVTGTDIDGDGEVGASASPSPPVILHAPKRPHDAGELPVLPVARDVRDPNRKLALDLAEFLTRGESSGFSRKRWVGQQLGSGTTISDGLWREWVGHLKEAEILESNNSGTKLTVPLDDALKCILHDWKQ